MRLPDDLGISALQALILEKQGEAQRALELLERLFTKNEKAPESARVAYIDIAVRNGLIDAAIAQFESMLTAKPSPEDKGEIYRALFSLEMHRKTNPNRAIALAFSYGGTANQGDEFEEALFLQMVTLCLTLQGASLNNTQLAEYERRRDAFLSTHPDSEYFSALQIPEHLDAQQLIALIRKKVGLTEEKLHEIETLASRLARGVVPIPYSVRPRQVLLNVGSVSHLWEITKRTRHPARSYQLLINDKLREPRDIRRTNHPPLLDLPTLLLITDLGLWEHLPRLFERIAVPKSILSRIQWEASHFGMQTPSLLKLRQALTDRISIVLQPGADRDDEAQPRRSDGIEELKELFDEARYSLYTDDYLARLLDLGDESVGQGLTTPDIIESLEKAGYLAVTDAARMYSQLVQWNIGNAPIQYRHLVAAIPSAIDSAATVRKKIDTLFEDKTFRPLADCVFR